MQIPPTISNSSQNSSSHNKNQMKMESPEHSTQQTGNSDRNTEYPAPLSGKTVSRIVAIGNKILPMLSKDKKARGIESSVLSYILSSYRDNIISKENRDNVTHADLYNWKDNQPA